MGSKRDVNACDAYVVMRVYMSGDGGVVVAVAIFDEGEDGRGEVPFGRSRKMVEYCVMMSYTPSRHASMYFLRKRATSSASIASLSLPSSLGPMTPCSRARLSSAMVRQSPRPLRNARASSSSSSTSIRLMKLTAFHSAGSLRAGPGSRRVDRRSESIVRSDCEIEAFNEAARGRGLVGEDRDARDVLACVASDSASEYMPFRTHVSMRTGTSSKSLSLSCCSRTTRAFVRSPSTSGPLFSLNSLAAFSNAGRDSVMSASRDVERDDSVVVKDLVVACNDRKVG